MKIAISMEMTRVLRNTWHSAINFEWYDFLNGHDIVPLSCHGKLPQTDEYDLIILAGGNDMHDITTWRDNNYPLRDQYEQQLIQQCLLTRTPVVGICRGAHFINWAFGGTHKLMDQPYDNVIVQLGNLEVTCHHTIQIESLAPGFDAVLKDNRGVIELSINKEQRVMGIGWHPEREVNKHTRSYILDLMTRL